MPELPLVVVVPELHVVVVVAAAAVVAAVVVAAVVVAAVVVADFVQVSRAAFVVAATLCQGKAACPPFRVVPSEKLALDYDHCCDHATSQRSLHH